MFGVMERNGTDVAVFFIFSLLILTLVALVVPIVILSVCLSNYVNKVKTDTKENENA